MWRLSLGAKKSRPPNIFDIIEYLLRSGRDFRNGLCMEYVLRQDRDDRQVHHECSDRGAGSGGDGGGSGHGDSGGENSGRCVHRNCCLRVKAAFAGRAKSPANTAFTTRAAITVVVVVVAGRLLVLVATAAVMAVADLSLHCCARRSSLLRES